MFSADYLKKSVFGKILKGHRSKGQLRSGRAHSQHALPHPVTYMYSGYGYCKIISLVRYGVHIGDIDPGM